MASFSFNKFQQITLEITMDVKNDAGVSEEKTLHLLFESSVIP